MITQLPRVKLGNLPTPLEEMGRLSEILGGPRIWIKRDDYTGLVFGGSKVRALEFTLADAINKGADTIVTMGEIQSNHTRLTTAAARKLGLNVVLVIVGKAKRKRYEGNLLLCDILGADIRFASWSELKAMVKQTVKELNDNGHVPYVLPFGGLLPIGTIGFVNAAFELQAQVSDMGLKISHIVHATATGGTQAGLTVGNRILGARTKIVGVASDAYSKNTVTQKYLLLASDICRILNIHLTCGAEDLLLIDHFSEENHNGAIDENKIMNTIRLVAETEGVILDPEYTGKAMAVLIDMVKRNRFDRRDNVVFIHTGGTPALFTQRGVLSFPIPSGVIRLYRKYGRRYKLVRWLRNIIPVSA